MTTQHKQMIVTCQEAIEPRLHNLGFVRQNENLYRKRLGRRNRAQLRLTWYVDPGSNSVSFSASAGVKFPDLSRLHRELRGLSIEQSEEAATVSRALALLIPPAEISRSQIFHAATSTETAASAADNLADLVEKYGLPFLKKHRSVSEAVPLMGPDSYAGSIEKSYGLMIAYASIGERKRAMNVFCHWANSLEMLDKEQLVEFLAFKKTFLARMSSLSPAED